MREIRGVEVETDASIAGPLDPPTKVLRSYLVTIHGLLAELSVERVQVEPMAPGNQRERLVRVCAEFVGRTRLSRVVARRGQAAGQAGLLVLKADDVVALPAVKGDGNRSYSCERGLDIDAELGIALDRKHIRSFNRRFTSDGPCACHIVLPAGHA